MLANTDVMGSLATTFAPLVNSTLRLALVKRLMDKTLAIDHHRTFPAYSGQKFESWFRKTARKQQSAYDRRVSYFHGCYVNYNYPKQGQDFVKVMNAIGYGVHLLEKEKCCGVALISNRMEAEWEVLMILIHSHSLETCTEGLHNSKELLKDKMYK
jgi:glycerol-3-phosphate dehydrogenase subunit C